MRTALVAAAMAVAVALPVAAAREASAQEISVSGGQAGEVNVYVAEEGDSLWDIADRFFNDPWYWPTLWSFNPHITNPNWIFPGDLVYLVPPKPVTARPGGLAVTETRYSSGPRMEQALGRRIGFISTDRYEGSGELSHSREEKRMLSDTDEGYVKFQTARRVKPGDLFLIYRVEGKVKHPGTGKKVGFKVRYLGVAKATSTEAPYAKVVVLTAFEEVQRGDRMAPFAPVQRLVPPVRNAVALSGTVIANFDDTAMIGENQYVVVDRGTRDGVANGNRFVVRWKGDGVPELKPKKKEMKDLPFETTGEILVIEAEESTSLGVVTYATREFALGVSCDMLAGY